METTNCTLGTGKRETKRAPTTTVARSRTTDRSKQASSVDLTLGEKTRVAREREISRDEHTGSRVFFSTPPNRWTDNSYLLRTGFYGRLKRSKVSFESIEIQWRRRREIRNSRTAWSHLHRVGSVVGIFSRVASVCPGDVKCPTWNVRPADVPADALRACYDRRSPPNGSLLPTFFSTGGRDPSASYLSSSRFPPLATRIPLRSHHFYPLLKSFFKFFPPRVSSSFFPFFLFDFSRSLNSFSNFSFFEFHRVFFLF